MRLLSITLRNYRLHREKKVTFDSSRTLIGGLNETGKSTLVEAIHRVLFLKAKGNTANHRAMQSSIDPGHPEVDLDFEAAGRIYSLKKRFGGTGTTTLVPSDSAMLTGDAAETELARILGVEPGVTGAAMTGQWAHLWVWQGQSGEDPSAHATSQQSALLQRLQQAGGGGALQSALDAQVAECFAELADETYTQNGRPRAGSELERLENAFVEAEQASEQARSRRQRLEGASEDYETSTRDLDVTEVKLREIGAEEKELEAKSLQLATLKNQEAQQQQEAASAKDAHAALITAGEKIVGRQKDILQLERRVNPLKAEITTFEKRRTTAKEASTEAQKAFRTTGDSVRELRSRHELAVAHERQFECQEIELALVAKARQAAVLRAEVADFEIKLAKIPAVDRAKMRNLDQLEKECSKARTTVQAMATGLEVLDSDAVVIAGDAQLTVGQTHVLTEDTEVRIGGGIRLRILPGGGTSLSDARQAELDSSRALQDFLDELGTGTVQEAVDSFDRRDHISSSIDQLKSQLQGMQADAIEEERTKARSERGGADARVERLQQQLPDVTAPTEKAAAAALAKSLQQSLKKLESDESEARAQQERTAEAAEEAEKALSDKREALEGDQKRLDQDRTHLQFLLETHGDDEARGVALVQAEARKDAASSRLKSTQDAIAALQPDMLENDRSRNQRAIKAQDENRLRLRDQIAAAKALLTSDGSEDPAAELAIADARARSVCEHRDSVRRKAQAVSLLRDLFLDEQRSMSDQFTKPLMEKMAGYLQCIFGPGAHAAISFDDNQFSGLRLVRPGAAGTPTAFDFDTLSGGAREQTAAAVRLAMAEVLAADHGGCLPVVFDDAFTNSDPERVNKLQRMLDLAASRALQVIVVSCNPADYASLGATLVTLNTSGNPLPGLLNC